MSSFGYLKDECLFLTHCLTHTVSLIPTVWEHCTLSCWLTNHHATKTQDVVDQDLVTMVTLIQNTLHTLTDTDKVWFAAIKQDQSPQMNAINHDYFFMGAGVLEHRECHVHGKQWGGTALCDYLRGGHHFW